MGKKLPDSFGKKRVLNRLFVDCDVEVIRWEVLPVKKDQRIIVRCVSADPENRQGIRIAVDAGEGTLTANGVTASNFVLWKDECPEEVEVECHSGEGYLSIYNVFEETTWAGPAIRSQMDYSGMILEKSGNIYRYRCNNARLTQDFDKLVFEIELV